MTRMGSGSGVLRGLRTRTALSAPVVRKNPIRDAGHADWLMWLLSSDSCYGQPSDKCRPVPAIRSVPMAFRIAVVRAHTQAMKAPEKGVAV